MAAVAAAEASCRHFFRQPVLVKILGEPLASESSPCLVRRIRDLFANPTIQVVRDSKDLNFTEMEAGGEYGPYWRGKKKLVVFPGSRDLKLWTFNEETQRKLQKYCELGVKVLGICAGAFFCSEQIIYGGSVKDHPEKYVSFFRGTCEGPAFPDNVKEGGIQLQTQLMNVAGRVGHVVMGGGGFFTPNPDLKDHDYEVLATYPSLDRAPPAAIACLPNKNRGEEGTYNAVLIGPHLEHGEEDLEPLHPLFPHLDIREMQKKLRESELFRLEALKDFFVKMGFK